MERREHGEPAARELAQQAEHRELRAHVEVVRRLVEEQELGFLREGACEVHPLALAAREGRVLAVGEFDEPRVLEAAPHDRSVEVAGSRERAEVRRAPERDDLGDPEAGGVLHVLLGEGDRPARVRVGAARRGRGRRGAPLRHPLARRRR